MSFYILNLQNLIDGMSVQLRNLKSVFIDYRIHGWRRQILWQIKKDGYSIMFAGSKMAMETLKIMKKG